MMNFVLSLINEKIKATNFEKIKKKWKGLQVLSRLHKRDIRRVSYLHTAIKGSKADWAKVPWRLGHSTKQIPREGDTSPSLLLLQD
jgi:hypothetical protein